MAWNQLAQFNSYSETGIKHTKSTSSDHFTQTITFTSIDDFPREYYVWFCNVIYLMGGHKYFIYLNVKQMLSGTAIFANFSGVSGNRRWNNISFNTGINTQLITQSQTYDQEPLRFCTYTSQTNAQLGTCIYDCPQVFDLTLIYGFGNEPSTVEQFEADYFKWFGHPISYEPYDPGSIRNTKVNGLKTIGFNQWDENMVVGALADENTGNVNSSYSNRLTTSLFRVIPNTQYYSSNAKTNGGRYAYYNHKKQCLLSNISGLPSQTISIPSYASYMRITVSSSYGTQIKHDICINLFNSKLNGAYEAYEDRTYSIPITSITGKLNGTGNSVVVFPDGMKSINSSIYDEIIIEDGVTKAIQRVGTYIIKNTDNVNWGSWKSGSGVYFMSSSETSRLFAVYPICNPGTRLKCNLLNYIGYISTSTTSATQMGIGPYSDTSAQFVLSLPGITTSAAVNTWIGNNGGQLIINYPLQTIKKYTLDNFNLPLNIKIWKNGSECLLPDDDSLGDTTSPKITMHYNIS